MRKLLATVRGLHLKSIKIWPQLREWKQPSVTLDLKTTEAGLALYFENKIHFNEAYYRKYGAKFLEETPGHELAHLINYQLNGPSVLLTSTQRANHHGKEWQNIMWSLGLIPRALHCYDMNLVKDFEKRS